MIDIYIHRLAKGIGRLFFILISFFDLVKSDAGRRGVREKTGIYHAPGKWVLLESLRLK